MKKLLPVLLFATLFALSGCNKDENGGGGNDDEKINVLVCMHWSAENGNCIVAMLPDGSQKRYLYRETESLSPKQGSIGSDGETLLMAESSENVYTYNLRTQTLTAIADSYYYEVPVFSSDMKKVYATRYHEEEFVVIDVATKNITVLDDENRLVYPSFKNDGETLIVSSHGTRFIASVNTDGTGLTMLKEKEENISYQHPLFVPALNKVVYVKDGYDEELESDYRRICLMNADGSGEVELTTGEVGYSSPSISRDGKKLAFFAGNEIDSHIFVTTLNGSSIGSLQTISEPADGIWRPQFNRIDKAVFESLPDFVRPTWE